MGRVAVVVNGIPGAGKTTLARVLGAHLELPVVAKDVFKEGLADLVSVPVPTRRIGGLAADVMWSIVGMIDGPVIVESFWAKGRDDEFFRRGLLEGGVLEAVEVWCEVPVELARSRFQVRPRHPVHQDHERLGDWEVMVTGAGPISAFPVIRVDTSGDVDVPALAETIRGMLPLGAYPFGPASGCVRRKGMR